ncbi:MAG: hypothetical protein HZA89_16795 [Verrucomicrobia bacterium]|nr:hypothetical protein [Verrucomicrobiota bacterium]
MSSRESALLEMSSLRLNLKSWNVAACGVAVLGGAAYFGLRVPNNQTTAEFTRPITAYLVAEHTRRAMATFAPAGVSKLNREGLVELHAATKTAQSVLVQSVEVNGTGLRVVARVRYQVDGKVPPDGREIRYLRLSSALVGGWMVDRETTALSFLLAL